MNVGRRNGFQSEFMTDRPNWLGAALQCDEEALEEAG